MAMLDGNEPISRELSRTRPAERSESSLSLPPRHYRQGDVLLLEVRRLPAEVVRETRDGGRLVLAYGEATGHAHVVAAPRTEASLYRSERRRYLELVAAARLVHEEHAAIVLPPATYEVRIQREYVAPESPAAGRRGTPLSRRVVD